MIVTVQVSMLYELMGTKKEDEEFVLQIAHSLTPLLSCEATRTVLLQGTQVNSCHSSSSSCLPTACLLDCEVALLLVCEGPLLLV